MLKKKTRCFKTKRALYRLELTASQARLTLRQSITENHIHTGLAAFVTTPLILFKAINSRNRNNICNLICNLTFVT